ncbi:MAG: hypothetical protein R3D58_06675 [Saprospiraceae bacterium]
MEPVIISQVKEHLAQGDFDNALELLNTFAETNFAGSKANKLKNEIIYLKGQIAEVKKAESRGLIAFEQAERNRNQIRLSMISLTDAVASNDDSHPVFSDDRPPAGGAPAATAPGTNIYKYIVVGIGAIILFVVGISMCEDSPENASTTDGTELTTGAQNGAATDGHSANGPCYLETLDVVDLLADADFNAETVGTLPANAQFEILQTKIQIDSDGEFEFHLVETEDGQGWVEHNDNLIRLSAGCN